MRVREIRWYRKEEEMFNARDRFSFNYVLSVYDDAHWFGYIFFEASRYAPTTTREEFEQGYLTYQGRKNEN